MTIYDAAMRYSEEASPLVIFAGKEYGTGSSRDWAAKGNDVDGRTRRSLPNRSSEFTGRIWSAWAFCRCSSKRANRPRRSGLTAPRRST